MEAKGEEQDNEDVFIIELLSFMCSPEFQAEFTSFYDQHAVRWEPPIDGEEHSHGNHELFLQFKAMVEQRIGGFLKSKGIDEGAFVSRSRRAMNAAQSGEKHVQDADEAWSHVLMQLLAGTEFDSFVELMQQVQQERAAESAQAESKLSHK